MAEEGLLPPLHFLRSLELRLLRCTLPSDSTPSTSPPASDSNTHLQPLIETVLQLIESGNYDQALSSDAAKLVFVFDSEVQFADSAESAELFYTQLVPQCVEAFMGSERDELEQCFKGFLVMVIAVAALLNFTQSNITGYSTPLPSLIFQSFYFFLG